MKYDRFVETGHKSFNDAEIKAFEKKFVSFAKEHIKVPFTTSCKIVHFYGFDDVRIEINLEEIKNKRNSKKDRIESFSQITFDICKEFGYIDRWDWSKGNPKDESYKDFKNAPDFQYYALFNTNGQLKPFRMKNAEPFYFPRKISTAQRGTELDDIDFTDAIKYLFDTILKDLK